MNHYKHPVRYKAAHRGCVYRYHTDNGEDTGRYAVVVSAAGREREKIVSILLLSDYHTYGDDEVVVKVKGIPRYLHCNYVTFCKRYQLGKKVGSLSSIAMMRAEAKMARQLGIVQRERQDFEKLYYDLLAILEAGESAAVDDDKAHHYGSSV